ncbi:MAG: hypothetical protein HWE10_01425 [Gammaproteobacteria bacterium]|nr:hypothetical protein [Gammaproteobacteria bacterium]
MKLHTFIICLTLLALQGCQSTHYSAAQLPKGIYLDNAFQDNVTLESADDIFYVSPEMKRYVHKRLHPLKTAKEKSTQLIRDLFDPNMMNIGYSHNANFAAADTFEKGIANCMSLTLLSYVLIKEAGLDAKFMDVQLEENWSLQNGRTMLNGHVNLKVTEKQSPIDLILYAQAYTIDFQPMLGVPVMSQTVLTKDEIIALYYNNKGGEALALGDVDLAYQYFKAGSQLAPTKTAIWNNLASLYRQTGFLAEAEQIYMYSMHLEPHNLNLKENLALLYKKSGRTELAKKLQKEVSDKRIKNPYYHAMLAEEALYHGKFSASLNHYKKAIALNNKEHRFYFGLARTYLNLGRYDNVQKSLQKAKRLADAIQDKRRYQSKISALATLSASL